MGIFFYSSSGTPGMESLFFVTLEYGYFFDYDSGSGVVDKTNIFIPEGKSSPKTKTEKI